MIQIPSNILNLLKSRQQIGENRPTGYVEFGGQPSGAEMKDPTAWTDWKVFTTSDRGHGNICETSDERAVVAYTSAADNSVRVAFAPTIAGVLDGSETFAVGSATVLASYSEQPKVSINLVDGQLMLAIYYYNTTEEHYAAEYWRDSDGRGFGFAKISDISLDLGPRYHSDYPSLVNKLGNGNLAVVMPYEKDYIQGFYAYYSQDNGETWVKGTGYMPSGSGFLSWYRGRTLFPLSADSYLMMRTAGSATSYIFHLQDSGATKEAISWSGAWGEITGYSAVGKSTPESATWERVGSKIFMHCTWTGVFKVLEFVGDELTPEALGVAENYQVINDINHSLDALDEKFFLLETKNALLLQGSSAGQISGAGTLLSPAQKLRPKSITVSRSKGSASQLTAEFENTGGKYAPDPAGPWNFILWPNNSVAAHLGYGQYLPKAFSGLVDDVNMTSPPQMISITARDKSKLALDQIFNWTWDGGITYYSGAWAAQDPEGIFLAIAGFAGFAEDDMIYDETGIIIPEMEFNQESCGDLLQRLAEMSGCEWYCDEDGKIHFELVEYPAAEPAYEFEHGVDIFSLGYKISDAELYRDVIVTAEGPEVEDQERETISVKVTWSAADYYKLPPGKTLFVTANGLTQDEAGCLAIANRMMMAITTKARQVDFVAVGIPNLQIGDCIKVTEASSTISEIYRVYEFEHKLDAEGSPVFATAIKCYWYAHGYAHG